jgi:hypothetical protein
MAQDRHILCAMALADATVVFPKADVEPPMERIIHAPVFSHRLGETDGITGQRGQEKSLLDRDLTTHFAVGLDKANTGNLGPRALHAYALDIRRDPLVACFQATMIDVSGRMTLRGWRGSTSPACSTAARRAVAAARMRLIASSTTRQRWAPGV